MDSKKLWIIGGVVVGVGSLWYAYKQYQLSAANAANANSNSISPDDMELLAAMQTPLSGASTQQTAYSAPSADVSGSVASLISALFGNGSTTSTATGQGSGTGSGSVNGSTVGQRIQGGIDPARAVGPEPVNIGGATGGHIGGSYSGDSPTSNTPVLGPIVAAPVERIVYPVNSPTIL